MLLRSPLAGLGLSVLFLAACSGGGSGPTATAAPTASPTPTPTAAPSVSPATINKTASTNTQAYTIVVQANGSATVTESGNSTSGTVPSATAAQFFTDLNANAPVGNIRVYSPCTKSASFGTATTVAYEGSTTGDVSCPSGAASPTPSDMVNADVTAIEQALGLN